VAVQFTIPGKPSAWQRVQSFVDKKTAKVVRRNPKDMKAAQETIAWAARAAMGSNPPMAGPLRLEILCVYAIPPSWPAWKREAAAAGQVWKTTVPDNDNLAKQVGDALNGVAYGDDAQVVRTSVGKRYGHPERTEVRLSRVDGLCDHSPREAFMDWANVHGSQAQMRAAGAWLAARRGQPSLPGLSANACDTLSQGERSGTGGSTGQQKGAGGDA
jgi:Holliday junction resolvase RusA-like endonuclease